MEQKITVIDAPCGSGKTEYIIRYINQHPEKSFQYISPLKEMYDRITGKGEYEGRGVRVPFSIPSNQNESGTKLRGIKELYTAGENILSTHQLFTMLDDEAIELAKARDMTLIIDEALDTVSVIKVGKDGEKNEDEVFEKMDNKITAGDIQHLIRAKSIRINKERYGAIEWIEADRGDFRYADIERLARNGALSFVDDQFLIWHFPIKALEAFSEIIILTYRFEHSIMRCYLDFNNKQYEHKTIVWRDDAPTLTDFDNSIMGGAQWREFVDISPYTKLNAVGIKTSKMKNYPMSYTWYTNNKQNLKVLKDNATNYCRHIRKAPPESVMWTTYKPFKKKVQPQGYSKLGKRETFVACSCKATEAYKDRYNLLYLIDRHINPGLKHFFAQKDIHINENEWALSELIQWMFRSRIRDSRADDRSIHIYIPSRRMRDLLKMWLRDGAVEIAKRDFAEIEKSA